MLKFIKSLFKDRTKGKVYYSKEINMLFLITEGCIETIHGKVHFGVSEEWAKDNLEYIGEL